MLIFDKFDSMERAESFAAHVRAVHQKAATIHTSQEQSDAIDPFPFALSPPIVLVERDEQLAIERKLRAAVEPFGGEFAGT